MDWEHRVGRKGIAKEEGRKEMSYEGRKRKKNEEKDDRISNFSSFLFIQFPTSVSVTVTMLTSPRHPLTSKE
jgi:hypothetical protein